MSVFQELPKEEKHNPENKKLCKIQVK